jgi:hypothetical protein
MSDTYLQRTVDQRIYRQKRVRNGDLMVDVVQPESALHLRIGDGPVKSEQDAGNGGLAERDHPDQQV